MAQKLRDFCAMLREDGLSYGDYLLASQLHDS